MEFREQRVRKGPQEPRGKKETKDLGGLLKYPIYWGTKENQASKVQPSVQTQNIRAGSETKKYPRKSL